MMFLRYVGTSDYRELSAADFTTLGAEAKKTRFVQHEVVEVPDDTGQILLDHEFLKGEFEQVEPEDDTELRRLQIEGKNEQSESLRKLEAGDQELPATTQRSGGATDADTAGTTAGTTGGTTGGTGRRGSRSSTTRTR